MKAAKKALHSLANLKPDGLTLDELKRQKSALDILNTEEDNPAIKRRKNCNGEVVEESTGTNGMAVYLPPECDSLYDIIVVSMAAIKAAERDLIAAQNSIRQFGGKARYYILASGRKAILRDLVYQPERTISASQYKNFRFVKVPEIDPNGVS